MSLETENLENVRSNRLGQADSDVALFARGFSHESQAKKGQKRGISSNLLYFYSKKQMYFAAHKGLFYGVLSHFIFSSLMLSISAQYVNLVHKIQKPVDSFYRFIFGGKVHYR